MLPVQVSLTPLPSPCRNSSEKTPLHKAAVKGHAEVVALLIEADAPLEAKDRWNVSISLNGLQRTPFTWQRVRAMDGRVFYA